MKQHDPSKPNDADRRPRSGGPQTPSGKKRSAANSCRHGILSESIAVLRSEREADYDALLNGYLDELQPVGFLETRLVQQMAWAEWRQIRAIRVESATIDRQMDLDNEKWQRDCPTVDDDTRTCYAVGQLVDESNGLQHLSRYETRFNRMYHRALKQLLELQEKRRLDGEALDSEPAASPEIEAAPLPEKVNLPNEQPRGRAEQKYAPRNVANSAPETPPPIAIAA
jgi:hypothetical protein